MVISLVLQVVSHIFQKAKAAYCQQRELGARGKGLKPQASTLVSKFQQSLQDLTAKLRRWEMLLWCIPALGCSLHPEVCGVFPDQHREEYDQTFFVLFCRSHVFFIRCITPNPKKVEQHLELLMESLSSLKPSPLQQLSFLSWGLDSSVSFESLKLFFPCLCLSPFPMANELITCWRIRSQCHLGTRGFVGFCVLSSTEHSKI